MYPLGIVADHQCEATQSPYAGLVGGKAIASNDDEAWLRSQQPSPTCDMADGM